ncbi:MAG: hypothetical protein E6Q83_16720 [Thiothrix sp.]|nr:MAG: hypothetical protein E6Q83_16720 [Thiothrix sp.]
MTENILFIEQSTVKSSVVKFFLNKRTASINKYDFNESLIIKDIYSIIHNIPVKIKDNTVNIIAIYSKERMCSALYENYIILDYGFIELLADSLLFESFSNELLVVMENINFTSFPEQKEPEITGSMLTRDISCKFIESLFSNENHQRKLLDLVLWPINCEGSPDHNERPTKLYYNRNIDKNILTNLINKSCCCANIDQILSTASQFVMCHELSHLVNPDVNTNSWKQSKIGMDVVKVLNTLLESELPSIFNDRQPISLTKIVSYPR